VASVRIVTTRSGASVIHSWCEPGHIPPFRCWGDRRGCSLNCGVTLECLVSSFPTNLQLRRMRSLALCLTSYTTACIPESICAGHTESDGLAWTCPVIGRVRRQTVGLLLFSVQSSVSMLMSTVSTSVTSTHICSCHGSYLVASCTIPGHVLATVRYVWTVQNIWPSGSSSTLACSESLLG
jgi:hypothetical protein